MSDSSNWLIHDHRKYEEALKACEIAAGVEEWKEAVQRFEAWFAKGLNRERYVMVAAPRRE